MSGVQHIEVKADADGSRLDRWLRKQFPHIGQGRIEKMCRKGDLRINGGRVKASARITEGQTVRVPPLPDGAPPMVQTLKPPISDADAAMIQSCVIYKDADLLVLNKPPGLAVQGGTKTHQHLDGLTPALTFGNPERPRLVHRLDRDTSGVIVLARSGKAAAGLAKAFQSRTLRKIYWAAVAGAVRPKMGTIRYGLMKAVDGEGPHNPEKMRCVHPDHIAHYPKAKRATTDYAVLEEAGRRASWVALSPITGRTHQLRAHMAEIGHPIVGDGKYGTNRQTNEGSGWGAQLGGGVSRKLHLHARALSFQHPVSGQKMVFTADLPDHMNRTWTLLDWDTQTVLADPFEEVHPS